MLHSLRTKNIGPMQGMSLDFGSRLNVITGDNGLGKSFVLDLAWWALTGTWARSVNPKLMQGYAVQPQGADEAEISFTLAGDKVNESSTTFNLEEKSFIATYDFTEQAWTTNTARPKAKGIVLYAMPDGSFGVWDSARNNGKGGDKKRPDAYIFSSDELWNGLKSSDGATLCNGMILDWALWQKEKGFAYERLQKVLSFLSPSTDEKISIGKLTRISLDDVRDIPTIKMPYGEEVPILYASSAIKRILALSYILVWALIEHEKASKLLRQEPSFMVTFLVDEVDAHLHPRWQRVILPALLGLIRHAAGPLESLEDGEEDISSVDPLMQLITITHAPLVLTSLEGVFEEDEKGFDAWFDIDFDAQSKKVTLTKKEFLPQGSSANWLTSDAFDLDNDFSAAKERVRQDLSVFWHLTNPTEAQAKELQYKMEKALPAEDILWLQWRKFAQTKGWNL